MMGRLYIWDKVQGVNRSVLERAGDPSNRSVTITNLYCPHTVPSTAGVLAGTAAGTSVGWSAESGAIPILVSSGEIF